jgi:heme-degrading monooxygenase HmoA
MVQGAGFAALAEAEGYLTTFLGMAPEQGTVAVMTFWGSKEALTDSEALEEHARVEGSKQSETGRGRIVDRYEVVNDIVGEADPAHARLVRWSGLNTGNLAEAQEMFKEALAPSLRDFAGFSWAFLGTDSVKGMLLGVTFWDSPEALRNSDEWAREAQSRFEAATGPRRKSIAETYEVAIVPELQGHPTG